MKTLYRASRVVTLSHPPEGEWLLVDERHVQRVGSGDPPAADRTVDLPGATILPGFIDGHVHLTWTGVHNAWPALAGVRSKTEFLSSLREAVGSLGGDGPLLLHGWDESVWQPGDLPHIGELDAISSEPLAVVRVDGHLSLANTTAMQQGGVTEAVGSDHDSHGRVTGVVRREANDRLRDWFLAGFSEQRIEDYQLKAASLAAAHGITCVHEMSTPAASGPRDLQVLMRHRDRLPVASIPYVATVDIPLVMDLGLTRIGGDLSLDGSLGAHTARLSDAYVDDGSDGVSYFGDDTLCEFLHNAHLAGLQVGLHAIGDQAIDQALRSWERVYNALDTRLRRHFRARRHRIEHFEMPGEGHIERAAILGLAISVQPAFDAAWGHPGELYEQRLGEARTLRMNPFHTMQERGLVIGGGSDAPITELDPMAGIRALQHHHDAVRVHTVGGALLAHLEDKKGRLDPGMHADFAAYDVDPRTVPDVAGLGPMLTVSEGREVFAE
jgi:predicted amidohydrolase YtcJ